MNILKKYGMMIIPFVTIILFILLNLFKVLPFIDNRIFDVVLHLRKSPAEHPALLMVDFDDTAIEMAGTYPVPRSIYADGLIVMKEMDARSCIFDIEYVDPSPRGVNGQYLTNEIPSKFEKEMGYLSRNISELFEAIRGGQIPLKEADGYISDLLTMTEDSKSTLLEDVKSIARDNDRYLGDAARFFGGAYFTIHNESAIDPDIPETVKTFAAEHFSLRNVTAEAPVPLVVKEIRPAILPVISGARGLGFTNAVVDEDGVRRKIDLIAEHGGKYYPQLSMAPLLDWLGNPEIIVKKNSMILKGAQLPEGDKRDIVIPLTEERQVLINWPHDEYLGSFREHLSFSALIAYTNFYNDLIGNIRDRADWGYFKKDRYGGETELMEIIAYSLSLRDQGLSDGDQDGSLGEEYRKIQDFLFDQIGLALDPMTEKALMEEAVAVLAMEGISDDIRETYETALKDIPVAFSRTREIYTETVRIRNLLKEQLAGAFCIVGDAGTGTTDIGVTPFDSEYKNVGTHASVVNTILQRDFLDDTSIWLSTLLAAVFSFSLSFIIRSMKPLTSILTGMIAFIVVTALLSAFFVFTGIYIGIITPSLSILLVFLTSTFIKFLQVESEKGFLRKAFSHYLSGEVIKSLIENPDRLKLGGEKKLMTAVFTDIRGFSTISEQLDPEGLVRLLNMYLSEMSDIILDLQGTIDKYEGDAIIAFFNAPIDIPDHPSRACLAAIRMKRAEAVLNQKFLESKVSPGVLFTRVGINSGEMVVGNMGTIKKMDYTIIGDSVNLAARLEGVNKVYGTAINISEDTFKLTENQFVTRKLDRIRVVGKKVPIRLYELIEEKGKLPGPIMEMLEMFSEGLEKFEKRDWSGASVIFERCLKINPEDGPSKYYVKRTGEYMSKEPDPNWDGVLNLTSK